MKWNSLHLRVGLYSGLVTIVCLVAVAAILIPSVRHHQVLQVDRMMKDGADELIWDLVNFRDAPVDPSHDLEPRNLPLALQRMSVEVQGTDSQIVYRSGGSLHLPDDLAAGETRDIHHDGQSYRVGAWQQGPYFVKLGTDLAPVTDYQQVLVKGLLIALPAAGLIAFTGGLLTARKAVAPVAALGEAAERISVHAPGERLPQPLHDDEIGRLARVLNRSFDRLQASYQAATRFSADASHQLKTPIAVLRAGLDHLSREPGITTAQQEEISVLLQQTRRLTALTDDLLMLSQADAGRLALHPVPLDLVPLISAAADDLGTLAVDKDLRVVETLPDRLPVTADRGAVSM
uniref:sensor histidine kinase n=1 Tax=Luteolibacter marinus TaxID=2776705 RepID=UPI001868F734